ncbi:MAG: universal stress protein [Geminicoccaceae bacterium]|nr:universal stress protein [Geminicoccaceae bacterium]
MAIKDLAVAYNGSANADAALQYAVQMCGKYGADLTGVWAKSPVRFEGKVERWMSKSVLQSIADAEAEAGRAVEAAFRERLQALGFAGPVHWVGEEGQPNAVLARRARFHDILLLGQFSAPGDARRPVRAEDLVLRAGRPLIVVPNNYPVRPFKEHAVVAWDGSRPAARALSDGMQILETKRRLDVLTIVGDEAKRSASTAPDAVAHLKRHGIDARVVEVPAGRGGVAGAILGYCKEHDPDVLIMGAYGHAKLREDLFGGTTRVILENMASPVLMAH